MYTLIIPHRVIQLTATSFWVPETRLRLPRRNRIAGLDHLLHVFGDVNMAKMSIVEAGA